MREDTINNLRSAIDTKCRHCIKLNWEVDGKKGSCPECGKKGPYKFCPDDGAEMNTIEVTCPAEAGKCPLQDVSAYYKVVE